MTAQELNRDIKRLYSSIEKAKTLSNDEFFKYIDTTAKTEFLRLYRADSTAEYMNLQSIKIMIKLNLSYRYISLYTMFINIKLQ